MSRDTGMDYLGGKADMISKALESSLKRALADLEDMRKVLHEMGEIERKGQEQDDD